MSISAHYGLSPRAPVPGSDGPVARRETGGKVVTFVEDFATQP